MRYPEPISRNASACEADGCDTWSLEPEAHGFIEVIWGDERMVYCKPDCLLKDIARRTMPTEVIVADEPTFTEFKREWDKRQDSDG